MNENEKKFIEAFAVFLVLVLGLPGCEETGALKQPEKRVLQPDKTAPKNVRPEPNESNDVRTESINPSTTLSEEWDVAYMANQKVGYLHTLTDRIEKDGRVVVHTHQTSEMSVKRFGDVMKITVEIDSYEYSDGKLYAIESRTKMANIEQHSQGRLGEDGKFHLSTSAGGKTSLDWSDDILGPYAIQRSLEKKPLKPGQSRTLKTFEPTLNLVMTITLSALRKEETAMVDGSSRQLLKIDQKTKEVPLEMSFWVDEQGNVSKSTMPLGPGMDITTYRVSRSVALQEPSEKMIDIGVQTLIKPDKPIPAAHRTKAVTYRLELTDKAAADSFPESNYQKILGRDENTLRLRVSRQVPAAGPERVPGKPGKEFIEANGFIQSDDQKIIDQAHEITAGVTDPWEKVNRLEQWVDRNMVNKDFSIGFASASEVLQTRQGDCTEHAVLLAAFCRAEGIPSRVAMGLVYMDWKGTFGYHMWTEVNLGEEWYATDGTLGQGYISGGHIKIADGSLQGASALSTFIPIIKVMGKLKIHVEKVE